jgi:phosphoglycolate phosphatase-like HAD superfamily hydrolase
MGNSILYALDFDGVICDSAVETAITGWKAAGRIWNDMPEATPSEMIASFRLVRPIIETGYEAILTMRLLYLGETTEAIYGGYSEKIAVLMKESRTSTDDLKKLFGETRDAWIDADLADWIAMNPLFSGIAEKLQRLSRQHTWYVITTKQERFVKQILQSNDIELADERIFGLDRKLSKPEVLKALLQAHPERTIHFVEDRLPTLLNVRQYPELAGVNLFFAPWGYNTAEDKALSIQHAFVTHELETFLS